MRAFREWRLRRAYRRIARLEVVLRFSPLARQLRSAFAEQTIAVVHRVWRAEGLTRQQRRNRSRNLGAPTPRGVS